MTSPESSALSAVIREIEDRRGRGDPVDVDDLVRRNPQFAEDIRDYLALRPDPGAQRLEPIPRTFGNYELFELIGEGGMGIVYRGKHRESGREVALKVIQPHFRDNQELVRRFHREATVLASIDHPGIVKVVEAGEADGEIFLAMELVSGETLADVRLSPDEAVRVIKASAEAMGIAHQHGIIHRDLKPANILLRSGQPCIVDFGLVRYVDDSSRQTATGAIVGTLGYMAPEQRDPVRQDEVGPRTDVYGLGAILYEKLTGRRPNEHAAQIVPPREWNPMVSRPLEDVVLRCLADEPTERPRDCKELADLLARLRGEPVPGNASPSHPGLMNVLRRWGMAPGLAGLLFVLVGASTIGEIISFSTHAEMRAELSRLREALGVTKLPNFRSVMDAVTGIMGETTPSNRDPECFIISDYVGYGHFSFAEQYASLYWRFLQGDVTIGVPDPDSLGHEMDRQFPTSGVWKDRDPLIEKAETYCRVYKRLADNEQVSDSSRPMLTQLDSQLRNKTWLAEEVRVAGDRELLKSVISETNRWLSKGLDPNQVRTIGQTHIHIWYFGPKATVFAVTDNTGSNVVGFKSTDETMNNALKLVGQRILQDAEKRPK